MLSFSRQASGGMSDEGWKNDGGGWAVTIARTLQTKGKHGLQYTAAIQSPLYSEKGKESIGNNSKLRDEKEN